MSDAKKARAQKVYVIQRVSDGMFCSAVISPSWVPTVAEADFVSANKFKGIIRADWGRDIADYRMVEVVPAIPDSALIASEAARKLAEERLAKAMKLQHLHAEALSEIKATVDGQSSHPVKDIVYGLLQEIKEIDNG